MENCYSIKNILLPESLICHPGAKICLQNLCTLKCSKPLQFLNGFFIDLSKISHHINEGLITLIKSQKRLKSLYFRSYNSVIMCSKIGHALISINFFNFHHFSKSYLYPIKNPSVFEELRLFLDSNRINLNSLNTIKLLKLEILDVRMESNFNSLDSITRLISTTQGSLKFINLSIGELINRFNFIFKQ